MRHGHPSPQQAMFDRLAGRGSPLAGAEPDYLLFCAEAIAAEVDALATRNRWRSGRATERVERDYALFDYEDLADGTTRVSTRPDALRILALRAAAPVIKAGRGRPRTSAERAPLIAQIFHCYPAGSVRLSSRRESHFEATVRLALELAGDVIEDVRAECRAALAELRLTRRR